jgi:hypothetical protein
VLGQLSRLRELIRRGLGKTAGLFPPVRVGFGHVRRVARLLGREDLSGEQVKARLRALLGRMAAEAGRAERRGQPELAADLRHFVKVSDSYEAGLFHCYDVEGLPRTNNDLEHLFGSVRYHERRASGRKVASPGLVVRGGVRLVAAVAARLGQVSGPGLAPRDLAAWRRLRAQLGKRQEARRRQRRFRRDEEGYLRHLEDLFLQSGLPS